MAAVLLTFSETLYRVRPRMTGRTAMAPIEHSETTEDAIAEETLVEEVSIDGMCGVY